METGYIVIGTFVGLIVLYLAIQAWQTWQDLRPNKMRAVFVDANRQVKSVRVSINSTGKDFSHADRKYSIIDKAVFRVGMFRVPTSYYRQDRKEPINLWDMVAESEMSAADFKEATESHVARDIINAFDSPLLSPTTSMLLIAGAVVVALGWFYMQISGRLDEIAAAVGVVSNG